ncbi:MAG TPA: 2-amino-4-hydroxy-6-hydroxymethyldihydropteridine diphosphokinase [Steroidobacteraceae bacterium]|nr:2-amino-4-hydroxy-6-hydroxymethyldihydropteridine diphosphokinase [Steroidobacteraceae bacterium]
MPWHPAYVGVGSNLDDPAHQVRRALAALAELPDTRLYRSSSLYGSRPLGGLAQPDYVNAAAGLLTRLELHPFFDALRALELRLGRAPGRVRWAPRRIDLDLLLFSQLRLNEPGLTLPHPGLLVRNFVLRPLAELAPELTLSGEGRIVDLAARLGGDGLWPLERAQGGRDA